MAYILQSMKNIIYIGKTCIFGFSICVSEIVIKSIWNEFKVIQQTTHSEPLKLCHDCPFMKKTVSFVCFNIMQHISHLKVKNYWSLYPHLKISKSKFKINKIL